MTLTETFSQGLSAEQLMNVSNLALAHVGDCVYELYVRTRLVSEGTVRAGELHRRTVEEVRARAQAKAAERMLPLLCETELEVFRRARNAHTTHVPKGATGREYAYATALEALAGWLYLSGKSERLFELLDAATKDTEAAVEQAAR